MAGYWPSSFLHVYGRSRGPQTGRVLFLGAYEPRRT